MMYLMLWADDNSIGLPTRSDEFKQQSLKAFVGSHAVWDKDSVEYKLRLDAVRAMVVGSSIPVSLMDQDDFRRMIHTLDPKFTLPGTMQKIHL